MNTSQLPAPASPPDPSGPHQALLALRARAEKRRQLVTQASEHNSPEEIQRLVQELQVHQIELEMQYEELLLAQAEVLQARAQYVDLYDFAPVGYFSLSPTGHIEQLNLCAAQQLGTVRQRLVGRRFALFVVPTQRLEFGQFIPRVLQAESTISTELSLQREDGSVFFGRLEGVRVATPTGWQCRLAVLDITAHHRAVEALAASEARFRKLFSDSSDAVTLLQGQQYVDCNAAALRLLGLEHRGQLVGRPAWAHAPTLQPNGQPTSELFRESMEEAIRYGSKRCEAVMYRASGEEIGVEAVLTSINTEGVKPLVHIVWRDVTATRAAAAELRQSQQRLQMALSASESGVWGWDIATNELYHDGRARAIFGLQPTAETAPFEELMRNVHPADKMLLPQALQRTLKQGASLDLEHRIGLPDGEVRYVALVGRVVHDEQGHPQRLTGIVRDVTERRVAELALRRQKEFIESLLENTIDGVVALDRQQRITAWNAEATRYFGHPAAEVLGRCVFEVVPLDEGAHQAVARALAGEPVTRLGWSFPNRAGHYDVYLLPLKEAGQELPSGVLVLVRDVTERDRLAEEATQQRLRQQQEVLAAILTTQENERKRIAEAIHNGLGQLLYATKLSLETQGKGASSPVTTLKLLDEAVRTTRTISFELTPGILEDFGLRIALEELVKRISPSGLSVRLHLTHLEQRAAPQVEITVYRVVQELLNNVMKHAHATEVEVHIAYENKRFFVSVEDNGQGFDPAQLTDQPLAGIGLAGVRNRVALLGGELCIKSRLGRGTIVSFELTS